MEEYQKNHIRKNLPALQRLTTCSSTFLVQLYADGMLSREEVNILMKMKNIHNQSMEFYNIIQTRCKSFNCLKQALSDTSQSGAFEILQTCVYQDNAKLRYYDNIGYNKENVLGRGSYNTKVYGGKYGWRDVAVKFISKDDMDKNIAMKEIQFLKKLDWHENILRYFDMAETEDFILLALELCDTNLYEYVTKPKSERKFQIEAIDALHQATKGLAHLHKNNVVHCDLKPENILIVCQSTEDVRIKISDFGMARKMSYERSRVSVHTLGIGTYGWMAPEVVIASAVMQGPPGESVFKMGFASDIFSLGCVFYFALTEGSHPFGDHLRRQVNIVDGKYEVDEQKVQQNIIKTIEKMIARRESDRPSASDVLQTVTNLKTTDCLEEKSTKVKIPSVAGSRDLLKFDEETGYLKLTDQFKDKINRLIYIIINQKYRKSTMNIIQKFEDSERKPKINGILTVRTETNLGYLEQFDISIKDGHGITQLHLAAEHGAVEVVSKLIQLGADVNAQNKMLETPLHRAVICKDKNACLQIIKNLINNEADAFVKDKTRATFLHKLLLGRVHGLSPAQFHDITKYLIEKGYAKLFSTFGDKLKTPLHLAVERLGVEEVTLSLLQQYKVNFNAVDDDGNSILFYAIDTKHSSERLVSNLIKFGANYKHKNKKEQTALHLAAYRDNMSVLRLLLDLGLDVNAYEPVNGYIPLHCNMHGKKKNVFEMTRLLLENGSAINRYDRWRRSPLALVEQNNYMEDKDKVIDILMTFN